MLVGLAGRIGVGKTTVAATLAEHGAVVIDADRVAHQVLETDEVRNAVATEFGRYLLDADGRIHRPALAAVVFGPTPEHATALAHLEAIVHPRVRERMEARIDEVRRSAGAEADELVIVLDVPLLVQSGWAAQCHRVIEVVCDEPVRQARLRERGWSDDAIAWRDAAWRRRMPAGGLREALPAEKSVTVDTSTTISYTREQVDRVWQWLRDSP